MLNLTVEPLDGSPALTSAVQFTPNAALGTPTLSYSTGNGNYAATWLSSTIAGLTGTATLGTLTLTVPATLQAAPPTPFTSIMPRPRPTASPHSQTDPHRPDSALRPLQLHL